VQNGQFLLSVGTKWMEAPVLSIPVIVLTTVVLWMAAIFAVLERSEAGAAPTIWLLLRIRGNLFCAG